MPNQPPQIINRSLPLFQQYTELVLKWVEAPYGDLLSYTLEADGVPPLTRNNENGTPVVVFALDNGFFLYVNMAFDSKKTSQLRSLSIHYYDSDEQLLRIDWSYSDLQRGIHAQPHWHMSPQLKGHQEKQPVLSFNEYNQQSYMGFLQEQESKELELDLSRMHLYMAYSGKEKSLKFDTPMEVVNWLEYTMDYIDKQIRALKNRSIIENSAGI